MEKKIVNRFMTKGLLLLVTLFVGITTAVAFPQSDGGSGLRHDAQVSNLQAKNVLTNKPFKSCVTLTNTGQEAIRSIDYTIHMDGRTVQRHLDLPAQQVVAPGATADIEVEGIPLTAAKAYAVSVSIDKVNGQETAGGKEASSTYYGVTRQVSRRTVVEEFTGTACGWCPRGWVGMEYLKEHYQDKFVGIAFHQYNYSDPMYVSNYYPYSSLGITGAPGSNMDRKQKMDPYYGTNNGIWNDLETNKAVTPNVDVSVTGSWNSDHSAVVFSTDIEALSNGLNFSVAYVLTADGLTGTTDEWLQANYYAYYYSASELPSYPANLAQFGAGGAYGSTSVRLTFNDVMIGSSYNDNGTNLASSISGANNTTAGTVYHGTHTVSMPTKTILRNAIHEDKVFANVLVIDNNTGQILNAARAAVGTHTEYTLSITSTGNGNVSYDGSNVRNQTRSFTVNGGASATLTLTPDNGYQVASLKVNNTNVTSQVQNNKYTVNNITGNTDVEVTFEAVALTLTAKSYEREYGEENPTFGFTSNGIAFSGTPTITCSATKESPVGTYDIVISQGSVDDNNAVFVNGKLTITKATLTAKAKSYTRKQNEDNPDFEIDYSGWKNNETVSVLNKKPIATTTATKKSEPGDYPISVSGGDAQNYKFNYVSGTLTITDADPIVVEAYSYTRDYGEENPTFRFSVMGSSFDGEPEITCSATKESPAGTYDIVITKGTIDYPNISFINGTLTIKKVPLTATARSYTRPYGEENPTFEIDYSGWKNDDDESTLTKQPTATTEATIESAVGSYPITVGGGLAKSYNITNVDGTLTIEKANQTLTWTQEFIDMEQYSQVDLTAEATSGLAISYSVADESICQVVTLNNLPVLDCFGLGETVLFAEQAGDTNWWQTTKEQKVVRIVNTSGIIPIDNSQFTIDNSPIAIYDLSGRKIVNCKLSNCKLDRGIYIINGKKVVVTK